MLSNKSLKAKTILAFTLVSSFLIAAGAINHHYQTSIVTEYTKIAKLTVPNLSVMGEMRSQALILAADIAYLTKNTTSPEARAKRREAVSNDLAIYADADKRYNDIPFVPGEEALYQQMNESWLRLTEVAKKVTELSNKNDDPKVHQEQALIFEKEFLPKLESYTENFLTLKKFQRGNADALMNNAEKTATTSQTISIIVTLLGFATALVIGFFYSSSLAKLLTDIAKRLTHGATEVASASQQLSSSSSELSASTTEQAASLQETTASMEEISAMIRKNSENATNSRDLSTESRKSADEGRQVVSEMLQAIQEIDTSNNQIMNQVEAGNHEISAIIQVIEEIGTKTKVINDIVFQTKLLSFNASVEAARAGEHGKGFAVVAEEVGNLAQMSGKAAKEIGDLLSQSIQKVNSIVSDTKTKVETLVANGKEKVETGGVVAKRCEQVLGDILKNVTSVDQMIGEIATASHEQSQGVAEVGRALTQLDEATQQNASVSQQTASASSQLSGQAQQLNQVVQDLVSLIEGKKHQQTHSAQRAQPVATPVFKQTPPPADHVDFGNTNAA